MLPCMKFGIPELFGGCFGVCVPVRALVVARHGGSRARAASAAAFAVGIAGTAHGAMHGLLYDPTRLLATMTCAQDAPRWCMWKRASYDSRCSSLCERNSNRAKVVKTAEVLLCFPVIEAC
jgi:hypothetical protein